MSTFFTNQRKILAAIVVLLIVLLLGWFYTTPYLAARGLKTAVDARDAKAIAHYVNFPLLRENLKTQLSAKVRAGNKSTTGQPDPAEAFSQTLAMAFIGSVVEALVTPQGLARVMEGENAVPGVRQKPTANTEAPNDVQRSMGYQTLHRFAITLRKSNEQNPVVLVLSREGWFSWRLTELQLP